MFDSMSLRYRHNYSTDNVVTEYLHILSHCFRFVFVSFFHCCGISGKILVFYIIFYAALSGFFAGLLAIFWQTLDTERPKWQLGESIIGTNPGLGFRPMPPEAHLGSTLIWYKSNRPDNMIYWHDTVNKFLDGKLHIYLHFFPIQNTGAD